MNNREIQILKQKLGEGADPVDVLDNVFNGRCALVISAGPSAAKWNEVYQQEKSKIPIVVCIKGTLNLVEELCDIHFVNSANLKKYKSSKNILSIMTDNGPHTPIFGEYDVKFKVMYELIGKEDFSLARNKNFECFTLKSTGLYRPFGPGIMYESVFYTLVHMGIKEIVCVGWDIADDKGVNTNFNDTKPKVDSEIYKKRLDYSLKLKQILTRYGLLSFAYLVKYAISKTYTLIKYYSGFKINQANMLPGEAELVSSSLSKLKEWLVYHNIKIRIISDSRWMSPLKD
jgi:hypothetical protein